jgi:hypothetical protein
MPIPPPPSLGAIIIDPPDGLVEVDTLVSASIPFTITHPTDLGAATWNWGNGMTSTCPPDTDACAVDPGDGQAGWVVGMVAGSRTYSQPGIYAVQLTVFDVFGQFDTSTYEFVVVYDPGGGFVSGGGWIDSPAGAYKPDPSLAGKASFGFVSRYKKGTSRPSGHAQFQFKVADLNFQSDSYRWLVVNQNGTRGQFKGDGTINGALSPAGDNYQFMLWATDGKDTGAPDTFRIKIWDEDESGVETIVYDNGFEQPTGGGSITVHRGKGK